jgi:predicted ATP-grasp superfamily ATP-dependent carboligase
MSDGKPSLPIILVTDARLGSATAIIRSLGQKGWRVIAADSDVHSPGLHSRYVHKKLIYPAPDTAPREFLQVLSQTVCDKHVDLIIPVTDMAILPLSAARASFESLCKLALPEPVGLDFVTDKLKTLELAERIGVCSPRTVQVQTVREAQQQASALGWPVVLKPQRSRVLRNQVGSNGIDKMTVCYANTTEQLAQQMQRFEGHCPVLLQEYYSGIGYGVELLLHKGRPLAAFQHKRLREIPINGGPSSFRVSVPLDPVMYNWSVSLLQSLDWTGLAMVEFKVGAQGPKLMEINGRIWGSLPLAVHSGMDFPSRMAELYLFGPPNSDVTDVSYRIGVHARNLELDLMWIFSVLLGRRRYPFLKMPLRYRGILALFGLLNPASRFDILSLRDPKPGLYEIRRIAAKFGAKMKQTD